MVITCPACSSRYRLSEERIQGRGAKITCPTCQDVFVVMRDEVVEALAADAPAEDSFTGLSDSIPGLSASTGRVRIVSPGPRKSRREVATVVTGTLPAVEVEEEELVAADLDFSKVGILTWKVRQRIGLTYDFSDIRTLRRYLADERVGPDDHLSPDGKNWVQLADIEDLETHFIDAYRAARAAGGAPMKRPEPKAPDPSRPTATDPFRAPARPAAPRRREAARRAGPPRKEPRSPAQKRFVRSLVFAGLALAWFLALTRPGPDRPDDGVEPLVQAPDDATPDDESDRIDEIQGAIDHTVATVIHVADRVTPAPVEPTTTKSTYLPAPSAARGAAVPPRPVPGEELSLQRTAGENWYAGGRRAMASSDFGMARQMFQRAVDRVPDDPRYWNALGEAQLALGDKEGAADSFNRADQLGGIKAVR